MTGAVRALAALKRYGFQGFVCRLWHKARIRLLRPYDCLLSPPDSKTLACQHDASGGDVFLFSVIVPTYNANPVYLRDMAASVTAQSYPNWELCLYDGGSDSSAALQALRELSASDARIHVIFGERNLGISGNSNAALAMARGDYIALCDHDDLLTPDALYELRFEIARTGADILYSDELLCDAPARHCIAAHIKPDYAPDDLRAHNYICHLMALKRSLALECGGFRSACDGAQDHDLALRVSERASAVAHVRKPLYLWRMHGASMSHVREEQCARARVLAVGDHLKRLGEAGEPAANGSLLRVRYPLPHDAKITLILNALTARDAAGAIAAWSRSIPCAQILLLTNAPAPPAAAAISPRPGENRAALLRRALSLATGDLLLFVDAALRPFDPDAPRELLSQASRNNVGVVSAPIRSMNGSIMFSGITLGPGQTLIPRCAGLRRCHPSVMDTEACVHNVFAVSSAMFAVKASHLLSMDVLPDALSVVRLCVSLASGGLRSLITPYAAVRVSAGQLDPLSLASLGKTGDARWHDPYSVTDNHCAK